MTKRRGSTAEQPQHHQQHHGAEHADHDGDDDAARIGARRDDAGQDADDQADQDDPENMHCAPPQTSNVASTGTWSDAFSQSRVSASMWWLLMAPDSAGVARMWSSRRPRLETRQS